MAGLDAVAVQSVYDALLTHARQLGLFERALSHEPAKAPGNRLSFAMTEGPLNPAPSGLAATSVTWQWHFRLYSPWGAKPAANIDPELTAAAISLMASLAGDIDLTGAGCAAGLVRDVDVLGSTIDPKWLDQDGSQYRVRDITVTVIINDAYAQGTGAG